MYDFIGLAKEAENILVKKLFIIMSTTLARKTSEAFLTLINLLLIPRQVSSSKSADFIFIIFFHPHFQGKVNSQREKLPR